MSQPVYYNDSEPFVVAWLKNLIAAGHLPAGDVDDRPIQEVGSADVRGYAQCHFFAGIGGWAYALQLAGWPNDRPVWTGSCPCQPFSAAGRGESHADVRHLWPAWFRLIAECRPHTVFGEQVSKAIDFGWLDAIARDLEPENATMGSGQGILCPVCFIEAAERAGFHGPWIVAPSDSVLYAPRVLLESD